MKEWWNGWNGWNGGYDLRAKFEYTLGACFASLPVGFFYSSSWIYSFKRKRTRVNSGTLQSDRATRSWAKSTIVGTAVYRVSSMRI